MLDYFDIVWVEEKTITRKHDERYKSELKCTYREVKSGKGCYQVINRSTNAGAESLNSNGVSDLPFFMFRLSKIFG